jgi:putative transposase
MMTVLDDNNHSVFLLWYHLVFVTKYRKNVIDAAISERLREIFNYIAPKYNIEIQEWNDE